jgi:nicotinamidase-related amidase
MTSFSIDPKSSALVLIDLQKGVVGRPLAPRTAADVVRNAAQLAEKFRALKGTVVLVNVAFHPDSMDVLNPQVDSPAQFKPGDFPADWTEIVPEIGPQPGDLLITKHQWGAFYGTELDLQLRRRAVRTIVLAGIATNIGVESTARDAYERGYHQVLVEDAMTSISAEAHEFAVKNIFPRLGNVRLTEEVLAALSA